MPGFLLEFTDHNECWGMTTGEVVPFPFFPSFPSRCPFFPSAPPFLPVPSFVLPFFPFLPSFLPSFRLFLPSTSSVASSFLPSFFTPLGDDSICEASHSQRAEPCLLRGNTALWPSRWELYLSIPFLYTTHTHINTYLYIYIYVYICTYTCAHMCTYTLTSIYVNGMSRCQHMSMCLCMSKCPHVHLCMCAYTYIHI